MTIGRLTLAVLLSASTMCADVAGLKESPEMTGFVHHTLRRIGLTEKIPVVLDPKATGCGYASVTRQGNRYIGIDLGCSGPLYVGSALSWRAAWLLLHELGHHAVSHVLTHGHSHAEELEADSFAGWGMRQLGASLDEALAFSSIVSEQASLSHPARAARVAAVTEGWKQADAQMPVIQKPPKPRAPSGLLWQDLLRTPLPWSKHRDRDAR